MTTLLGCVDETDIYNNFEQLETDSRENIEFLLGLVCEQRTEQLIYWWQTRNFNFVFLCC